MRTSLLIAVLCCAVAIGSLAQSSMMLTYEHLREVGLHFAPEFKSLADFANHAASLPDSQEVKLDWESYPGRTKAATASEAVSLTASKNFVVQSQRTLSQPPREQGFGLVWQSFVFVAVDESDQIRGVQVARDPRVMYAESAGPNGQIKGGMLIFPKGSFDLQFPNDPAISRILMYEPKSAPNGFSLSLFATIHLGKAK